MFYLFTGNACRSQIFHGLLNELSSSNSKIFSTGTHPSQVHPISIAVMEEIGIDISKHASDHINDYLNIGLEIVITVCDYVNNTCPVFPENARRINWSIVDPFRNWNSDLKQLSAFRVTREEIKLRLLKFIQEN